MHIKAVIDVPRGRNFEVVQPEGANDLPECKLCLVGLRVGEDHEWMKNVQQVFGQDCILNIQWKLRNECSEGYIFCSC